MSEGWIMCGYCGTYYQGTHACPQFYSANGPVGDQTAQYIFVMNRLAMAIEELTKVLKKDATP
jgi:hypothetical protein